VLPKDPSLKEIALMQDLEKQPENISKLRNKTAINKTYNERDTTLNDFYTTYDENKSSADQFTAYEKLTSDMTPEEKEVLNNTEHFYEISFERIGGIVMPIVYKKIFEDGTEEIVRIPAEIWKMGDKEVTKVEKSDKKIISFILDPFLETADIDTQNNYFPRVMLPTRFEIYKNKKSERTELNPMQKAKKEEINRP
jgi:hypothetical protein